MSHFAAQVSLYPLGEPDLAPMIDEVLRVLEAHGLQPETGAISTVIAGDDSVLFAALHQAAQVADAIGKMVMVVTISNACAVPER